MIKQLALSLLPLTGISEALNTGNVLDPNPTDGFLDGIYDYPNIHSHSGDAGVVFTGDPRFRTEADELVKVSDYLSDTEVMSGIDWAVDYNTYGNAIIAAGIDLYDINNTWLATDGRYYQVEPTANQYVTLTGSYTNEAILKDVEFISFTIGGVSEYNGTDDIRLTNATLSIDYYEPVVDAVLEEIINDIIENIDTVVTIEDVTVEPVIAEVVEEIVEEVAEVVEVVEVVEVAEVVVEAKAEVKTVAVVAPKTVVKKQVAKVKAKAVVKKTVKKQVKKTIKKSIVVIAKTITAKQGAQVGEATTDALQTLNLIKSITVMTQVALVDTVDISSYTGITLSESVELEDSDDWYQDQAFYSSIGMTDSGILQGYSKTKINDNGEWYGSNNQFY